MFLLAFFGVYLIMTLITARILWLTIFRDDGEDRLGPLIFGFLWPVVIPVAIVAGLVFAAAWLVSLPTHRERKARRQAKRRRELEETNQLAKSLDLPTLGDK